VSREVGVVRAYRALVRLLPPAVRERDGEEMVATFAAMWSAARGRAVRFGCLLRSFGWLPVVALAEWRDHLEAAHRRRLGRLGGVEMDGIRRGVWVALRGLLRSPAFTLSTVLLLGLGVGAVTTIFTIVDHLFLRPLPYPSADRLVLVSGSQSYPALRDFQSMRSVEAWAAASIDDANLTGEGDPVRLRQARITDGFFTFFGARPTVGRLHLPEDFAAADVVVLSEAAWERLWGRDRGAVGRTIRIDGAPVLVVGVLARSFSPPEALLDGSVADVWRPIDRSNPDFEDRFSRSLVAAGRLAPGATMEDARQDAAQLAERRARDFPRAYVRSDGSIVELPVVSLQDATAGRARESLQLLLAGVALLLLVACANVAHLFMARGLSRSREMALRRALGAGTPALAGHLLTESLLVAVGGSAIGGLLAVLGVRTFLALSPEALPRAAAVAVDARVLAFAALVSATTAIAFGLLPALRVLSGDPGDALRGHGPGMTGGRGARVLRGGLVMAEVALSLVLVSSAGLLIQSFASLRDEPLGFRVDDVWTIRVQLAGEDERSSWIQRMERISEALRLTRGVRSVTYGLSVPLEHTGGTCCWSRPVGRPDAEGTIEATIHPFAGEYLDVFEPRVLAGRQWDEVDAVTAALPALLNERMALDLFGSVERAVGAEVALAAANHLVVGVVAEDRHYGLYREHGRAIYVPIESVPFVPDRATLAVRIEGAVIEGAVPDVPRRLREAVWSVEPDLPVPVVRSMDVWAAMATARTRFDSWIFTTFGVVGLLLAAAGLYGTLLYAVGTERRELGIRLALGARRRSLEARVLGRGLRTAGAGAVAGGMVAWASGRLLQNRLYGIEASDPATLATAVAVLLVTAAVASWLPARRAAATDPIETLRQE
jgi:predicted permease